MGNDGLLRLGLLSFGFLKPHVVVAPLRSSPVRASTPAKTAVGRRASPPLVVLLLRIILGRGVGLLAWAPAHLRSSLGSLGGLGLGETEGRGLESLSSLEGKKVPEELRVLQVRWVLVEGELVFVASVQLLVKLHQLLRVSGVAAKSAKSAATVKELQQLVVVATGKASEASEAGASETLEARSNNKGLELLLELQNLLDDGSSLVENLAGILLFGLIGHEIFQIALLKLKTLEVEIFQCALEILKAQLFLQGVQLFGELLGFVFLIGKLARGLG